MAVVLSVGEVCYAAVGKLTQDPTLLATGIEQAEEEGIRDSRLRQVSWDPWPWRWDSRLWQGAAANGPNLQPPYRNVL